MYTADGRHYNMKKIMHLLAVSAGGGLLVGAGIRLAEKSRRSEASVDRLSPFLARIESLENRIDLYVSPVDADPEIVERERGSSLDEIAAHIVVLEKRLRQDLEHRHGERMDRLSDALEKRLTQRIVPIEAEMENQQAAVGQLRDLSLRTEASLQKLLEGIEKLVASQPSSGAADTLPF